MRDIAKNDLVILDEFRYMPLDAEKRAAALPGGVELLRESQHDIHDEHRVLEMGNRPRRRQARIGHDRQDNPPWEARGVQRGKPPHGCRLDARKGKNTVKDVSVKVLKCNVPLC